MRILLRIPTPNHITSAPAHGRGGAGKRITTCFPNIMFLSTNVAADSPSLNDIATMILGTESDGDLGSEDAAIFWPKAQQAIDALNELNIRCMMLTGNNKATAKWISCRGH